METSVGFVRLLEHSRCEAITHSCLSVGLEHLRYGFVKVLLIALLLHRENLAFELSQLFVCRWLAVMLSSNNV